MKVVVLVIVVPGACRVARALDHAPRRPRHLHGVEGEADSHVPDLQEVLQEVRTVDRFRTRPRTERRRSSARFPRKRARDVGGRCAKGQKVKNGVVRVAPVGEHPIVGNDDVRQPRLPLPLSPGLLVGVMVAGACHRLVRFFHVRRGSFEGEDAVKVVVADAHPDEQRQVARVEVRRVERRAAEEAADVPVVPEAVEEPVGGQVLVQLLVDPVLYAAEAAARNGFRLSHAHRVLRRLFRGFFHWRALRRFDAHFALRLVPVGPAAPRAVGALEKAEIKYSFVSVGRVQISQPRSRQTSFPYPETKLCE